MEYNPKEIEAKWQQYWQKNEIYKVKIEPDKPKFYVLDMFPYPSGAGLHVGHPLGYIATDIMARYKKMKGFNVLHPMGFDSFGLPAEQYAIETGQHPAITTAQNIETFKKQLGKIGFNYDWTHEVQTSDPKFYKWTQWIFQQIFKSWYNKNSDKAEAIESLITEFEKNGNLSVNAECDEDTPQFNAEEWKIFSEEEKYTITLKYRLTYLADSVVNWCPALGTVLANDEIKDGVSERGGHPIERKKMKQWMMRITAYAEKLLQGLEEIDWSDALKEMQSNWIGKSYGAELTFKTSVENLALTVFTTRIDTIYGVTFMSIAPEHELIAQLSTPEQKQAVDEYVNIAKNRSERERQAEVKTVSGVFTGSYANNPFNQEKIPIWVADYVLAGYGTGVVMGVPSSDDRDFRFAKHFDLPIIPVIEGTESMENPTEVKKGKMINSGFLNALDYQEAIQKAIEFVEKNNLGKSKVNYRMRDAVFSRQRYWGEPVPVYFKNGLPYLIDEKDLPLVLPEIDEYKPTAEGEAPLARAKGWKYSPLTPRGETNFSNEASFDYEHTTMPGWAGSCWYFLRYMDAQNDKELASEELINYWQQVDLYVGGTEHAVGHLLYSRFWIHFLYDRGYIPFKEPFKKLINQGMIQGTSALIYRVKKVKSPFEEGKRDVYVSVDLKDKYDTTELHVDVNIVENNILDIEAYKNWRKDEEWRKELEGASFICSEDGNFYCGTLVEKMSKRWYNVVNPDNVIEKYAADTLRLYEMFLGPLEQYKPWNTQGIDGCHKFLKKLWRLFHHETGFFTVSEGEPNKAELKILHKTIKGVIEDIERYNFNTVVSKLMVCVNELQDLKCNKRKILRDLVLLIAPYAPHIAEELWHLLGNESSVHLASFPEWKEEYILEDAFEYPVSINGKLRTKISFPLDMPQSDMEKQILANEIVLKWTEGKAPKKVIIVPKKIVNVVL